MSQSSAASRERRRSATSRARSSRVPASLRRSPSSTSSRSAALPRRRRASSSALRSASATVRPASGRNPRTSLKSRGRESKRSIEADDLVVADQRDGGDAVEVPLQVVVALVVGDALVVERADDEDLPVRHGLLGGRVVVEVQDLAADLLVHAVVVDAREAAQVPLLEPPDVAVHAARRAPQPRGCALRDVPAPLRRGRAPRPAPRAPPAGARPRAPPPGAPCCRTRRRRAGRRRSRTPRRRSSRARCRRTGPPGRPARRRRPAAS